MADYTNGEVKALLGGIADVDAEQIQSYMILLVQEEGVHMVSGAANTPEGRYADCLILIHALAKQLQGLATSNRLFLHLLAQAGIDPAEEPGGGDAPVNPAP